MKRKPKKFARGQAIEFQRSVCATWELGHYVKKYDPTEWRGWHSVRFADGALAKYIDTMSGIECDRDHPQAFAIDGTSVPTQRLREPK
jgi:hypothetical protein